MKLGPIGFALIAVFLSGAVSPAAAIPIIFGFTGSVTDVPLDEVGLDLGLGTEIEGSYTFESTAADLIGSASSASYQVGGPPYGLTVDIGGNVFRTSDGLAVNLFDAFVDQYGVLACSLDLSCSGDLSVEIFLQDDSGAVLGSDLLPLTPPDLTSFATRDFHLYALVDGRELQISGTIDSLVCTAGCATAAPEPGALVLVGTGWGVLAFVGRHRRARRGAKAVRAFFIAQEQPGGGRTMQGKVRGILSMMMSVLLLGGPLVAMAQAVDGKRLIDQNKALAGNVTPADSPGFPVTISQPGSYILSSNLTVPDEKTTAIQITADNVTLDLNGFTIQGPTVCGGFPLECDPIGVGSGVITGFPAGNENITIVNGTVRGMGGHGVALFGRNSRVERLRAVSNGGVGIEAQTFFDPDESGGHTVNFNIAVRNHASGIGAGRSSIVTGNVAVLNGGTGIIVLAGSTVTGNTARNNGKFGLALEDETGYTQNVLSNNSAGAVTGGMSLGQNLCDGVVC